MPCYRVCVYIVCNNFKCPSHRKSNYAYIEETDEYVLTTNTQST